MTANTTCAPCRVGNHDAWCWGNPLRITDPDHSSPRCAFRPGAFRLVSVGPASAQIAVNDDGTRTIGRVVLAGDRWVASDYTGRRLGSDPDRAAAAELVRHAWRVERGLVAPAERPYTEVTCETAYGVTERLSRPVRCF